MKKNINLLFIILVLMISEIPLGVYAKEIVSIQQHGSNDHMSILYDDYTMDLYLDEGQYNQQYQLKNIKYFIRNYNHHYEYICIDTDNNLYLRNVKYSSTNKLILQNVKRVLTTSEIYDNDTGMLIETYDKKIYVIKTNDDSLVDKKISDVTTETSLYLLDNDFKEIKYIDQYTVYYTIDDSNNLYALGKNIIGSKINDGKYLSNRTLILEDVNKIDNNLILTNKNELYLISEKIPRPSLIRQDVVDFVSKADDLVYIKEISNKKYRFNIKIEEENYVRCLQEIDVNDIHEYDDTKKYHYYPSYDQLSSYANAYVYKDKTVYYNNMPMLSNVIFYDKNLIITENGNLYMYGNNSLRNYFSHLNNIIYDKPQLIDRNVKKIYSNLPEFIYQKQDNTIWGIGNNSYLQLINENISPNFNLPLCLIGDCKHEIILENTNINTAMINQQFDFYANAYPSNSDNLNVTWKSSDETIATVDNTGYIKTLKPGEVTITATLNNEISDSVKLNIIDDKNIFDLNLPEDFKLYTQGRAEITITPNLGDYDNQYEITTSEELHYSIQSENLITISTSKVGPHTLTFTTTNKKYTKTYEFIAYESITNYKVKDIPVHIVNGKEITPKIEIDGLTEGIDFTVKYENNINVGYAKVIITGIGYYYGTIEAKFYIGHKGTLSSQNIKKIENQYYTGKEITPKVEIEGLEENVDFTVTYKNNVNVGWAKVTIKGITYSGTKELEFYIMPIDIEYTTEDYEIYYDGKEHEAKLDVKTEDVLILYVNDNEYNEKIPVFTEIGTYTVKFMLQKDNYNDVTGEFKFTIKEPMDIEHDNIIGPYNYVDYDGKEHTLEPIVYTEGVTVKYMDSEGNYTLDTPPKYKNAGEYEIHYQLTKENYKTLNLVKILIINPLYIDYEHQNYYATYDKKEHTVDLKVNTEGVTVKYRDSNGEYTLDEPPKYIYPGKYTIYTRLTKENYQTVELGLILDIEMLGISYGYSSYIGMYDGKKHTITVDGYQEYENATIKYADSDGNYTLTEPPKYSNIGTYEIKFCIEAPHYKTSYSQAYVKILGIKQEFSKDFRFMDNKYLVINKPNLYLKDIKNIFDFQDMKMNLYINDNLEHNQILKTGNIFTIIDDPLYYIRFKNYDIVLMGDVNGDGKINYLDYVNVYNHIYKTKHPESNKLPLVGTYLVAADTSNDGKISYLDYVQIYNKIKELKEGEQ